MLLILQVLSRVLSLLSAVTLVSSTPVLLVTPKSFDSDQLLYQSDYLGSYGTVDNQYSVYRCYLDSTADAQAVSNFYGAHIVPIIENARIVYLQEAGVMESVRGSQGPFLDELEAFFGRVRTASEQGPDTSLQKVLGPRPEFRVLHQTPTSALVSVPNSLLSIFDTLLPRLFVPVVLPEDALPLLPVPPRAIRRISDVLATLKFDPAVASIVEHLSVPQMNNDVRFLTGEDGVSGIVSRHSFSEGARTAARWIKSRIESTGATCELRPFLNGFAPNVICRYPASVNTSATVLLGSHYDTHGTFGSTRAPGGNDDGSGVISLLGIARAIQAKGIAFRSNVELVAFAGEEQGALGSRAYAKDLRDANANLTLMLQADTLAYHKPGEPPQLALPDLIGTPVAAQLVTNISAIYSPELTVGFTPVCCSDHQTFIEQGFPATWVFERAGQIADPMYHQSGDLSDREGYDLEQVRSIAKVIFATLLHTAGFDVSASV